MEHLPAAAGASPATAQMVAPTTGRSAWTAGLRVSWCDVGVHDVAGAGAAGEGSGGPGPGVIESLDFASGQEPGELRVVGDPVTRSVGYRMAG